MARAPLQYVRGTAAQIAAYAGPLGEPAINTDTGDVHVQNATPGGVRQISDKSLLTPEGGSFPAPLISIIGRVMDLRKFGPCTISPDATAAQRDANTKTILTGLGAAYDERRGSQRSINVIDYPAGDLYLGQGPDSGTIRYNQAICHMQNCNDLLLRGNNTRIWLPGTNESNYLGFFTFVRNTGTCGFIGNWQIDQENPSVNQGRIVGYVPGSYIDVELDWAPTWSTVKCVTRWSETGKPLAFLAARSAAGLPMTRISGGTSLRYRIDISGNDGGGPIDILNPSLTGIGQRVSLQHCTYTANVLHALGNERILVDEGFTIAGGAGMGLYAQHSPIIWRGTIRRPRRNGVRSLLSTAVDGIHVKGCGPSDIRGTIEGTGDDAVNVACWTDPIVSGSGSTLVIALSSPPDGAPEVGQFVELIDQTRASQGSYRVTARSDAGNRATLTVDGSLPAGITSSWVAANRTTAEGYIVNVVARHCTGGGVRSSAADADITVVGKNLRLGLHTQGAFGGVEYIPAYDLRVSARGSGINCGIDPLRDGFAALAYNAVQSNGAFLPKGAAGSVRIRECDVTDSTNMVLYAAGLDHLTADNVRGDKINTAPVSKDGLPTCFAQVILCKSADLNGMSLNGTDTYPINLSSNDRVAFRNISTNITVPLTGATVLDLDLYVGASVRITRGRYEMWGSGSRAVGATSDPVINFPIPFPTACEGIGGGIELGGGSDAYTATISFQAGDRNAFIARPRIIGPKDDVSTNGPGNPKPNSSLFYWYAWGK